MVQKEAVPQIQGLQQQSAKTIRVGSSFLNPGNVLIDLWNRVSPDPGEYRFKIVPYDDDHQKILSVVSSLGKTMDFMVGSFNSAQMLRLSRFCQLGEYRLCVAVPRNHRLAGREMLSLNDLHGERLVAVKQGDTLQLDRLRELLKLTHPQIILEDADYFYDMETFNHCEVTGSLLLTLDAWAGIHPALATLPVDWDFTVPYGLLYAPDLSSPAKEFLGRLQTAVGQTP